MKNFSHYLIIFIFALAQTTFLPLNLILGYLLLTFYRRGFYFVFPIFIYSAALLALMASNSVGLTLFTFCLILGMVGLIKNYLPAALFIRASILILALPAYELTYSFLFRFITRL
ncbi:MAG: hypothetical protein Q8P13_01550 [bacterium]|nr:hypothetical protein [bacterium]